MRNEVLFCWSLLISLSYGRVKELWVSISLNGGGKRYWVIGVICCTIKRTMTCLLYTVRCHSNLESEHFILKTPGPAQIGWYVKHFCGMKYKGLNRAMNYKYWTFINTAWDTSTILYMHDSLLFLCLFLINDSSTILTYAWCLLILDDNIKPPCVHF